MSQKKNQKIITRDFPNKMTKPINDITVYMNNTLTAYLEQNPTSTAAKMSLLSVDNETT